MKIPIEVTAGHIHIRRDHVEILFGKDHCLTKLKEISMRGQFACQETLTLKNGKNFIENVRIVGPERGYTQIELSMTAAYHLGLKPPVRLSSDIPGTPGVTLMGPRGELVLPEGVILPHRHLHSGPKEAKKLGAKDGDLVWVEVVDGPKSLIFKNVIVRVHESFVLSMHVDTDEGNAAGINKVGLGFLL